MIISRKDMELRRDHMATISKMMDGVTFSAKARKPSEKGLLIRSPRTRMMILPSRNPPVRINLLEMDSMRAISLRISLTCKKEKVIANQRTTMKIRLEILNRKWI